MKSKLIINASRDGYSTSDIRSTITINDLIDYLEYLKNCEADGDTPVYLSFDGGYTYGAVRTREMEVEYEQEEEEEEEEEI